MLLCPIASVQVPFSVSRVECHVGFASLSESVVSADSFFLSFMGRCNPDEIQLYLSCCHTDHVVPSAFFQTNTSLFAFGLYLSWWQMLF